MLNDIRFNLPINLEKKFKNNFTILSNIQRIEDLHQTITKQPVFPSWAEEIKKTELIRSVGSTNAIEGSVLEPEEINKAFMKADTNQMLTKLEAESVNSRNVHNFILEWAENNANGKIDESLIRQIHTLTTRGIDYVGNVPGEYRDISSTIGYPRRETILKNRSQIMNKMREFVAWLNGAHTRKPTEIPFILAVMAHYYLSEIHPFGDGNGRTARALEALILYKYGKINEYCFYGLPNYCYRERNKYISELGKIYVTEDVTDFVYFCTEGFIENLTYILDSIFAKLYSLIFMDYAHQLRREKRLNKKQVSILQYLINVGRIEYNEFMKSKLFGISDDTKRRYMKKFQNHDLIEIVDENKIKTIYPNLDVVKQIKYVIP